MKTITELANTFGIELVKVHEFDTSNRAAFLEQIASIQGSEGVVIAWDNGIRVKCKANEYVLLHRTLDQLTKEKTLIPLILGDKLDDAKPLIARDIVANVDAFARDFFNGINDNVEKIVWETLAGMDNTNGSKKRFALEIVSNMPDHLKPFMFKAYDEVTNNGEDNISDFVLNNVKNAIFNGVATAAKCDITSKLWGGHRWLDYYYNTEE